MFQDLILTIYYYNKENNTLQHCFEHLVSNQKNDSNNLINCWLKLIKTHNIIKNAKKNHIISRWMQ